ncbi:MAG: phosphoribosylamine--glycine ligase [Candidatus Levybacteria bacterium]|nr:phosphoribosylamine--glycine ligase [Candidatus Levybacteria bacterium]
MKVLVIGSNGREHALAEKYAESKNVNRVFIAPGNGLTDFTNKKIKNVPIKMDNIQALIDFAKKEKVGLVDVAQDDCLAKGYVDRFQNEKIKAFGPTKKAAEIEWSKEWSRNFMTKYNLPIPSFKTFNNKKKAIKYIESIPDQLFFIKASGLALGKGVIKTENKKQAKEAIEKMSRFDKSGDTFLIEGGLIGEEFTLFAICDGEHFVITKSSQDHKTIFDKDKGPNTGGVGSITPTGAVSPKILKEIEEKIIKPTILGLKKEKRPYTGILYLGGMITKQGVKIIEFNARWGDPEAEVILPGIKTDYFDIVNAVIMKQLNNLTIKFDNKVRLSIAGCAKGYPDDYSNAKGKEIFGLLSAAKLPDIEIFGSGIKRKGKRFFINGGRIFHLVAEGEDIKQARKKAYEAISLISVEGNNLHYRKDIGWRDLKRANL